MRRAARQTLPRRARRTRRASPRAAQRARLGRELTRAWRGCRGILPLGQSRKDWNFSLQDKRVLNFENEVSDSDNIKQDISIDVYGRKE